MKLKRQINKELVRPVKKGLKPVRDFLWKIRAIFPVTWTCIIMLVICGLGLWFVGLLHKDIVLMPAAIALILICLSMVACVVFGAAAVTYKWKNTHFEDSAFRIEANYPKKTGIDFKIFPFPFIEVTWDWEYPAEVEAETQYGWGNIKETVTARHRCLSDDITRIMHVRDILGMAHICWKSHRPTTVLILPDKGALDNHNVMQSLSGGEDVSDPFGDPLGDRIEMRQYVPGDPSRNIIWKVYARNRKVMVRMPERALTSKPRTCAYMVSGPGDEASAGLARVVIEHKLLGENWCFGADRSPGSATTAAEALELLARSGNPSDAPTGLGNFLKEAEAKGYQSCLVFIPALADDWLERVKNICKSTRLEITWFMGIDRPIRHISPLTGWKRAALNPEDGHDYDPREVIKTLGSISQMYICNRTDGTVINDAVRYVEQIDKAG